jgi:DNA processing protein
MNDELLYQIALTKIHRIGNVISKNLISYCGGVKPIFQKKESDLIKIPGIGPIHARSIKEFKDFASVENDIKLLEKYNIDSVYFFDENYPTRLKNIPDSPILLYKKGTIQPEPNKAVGIVGTRKITSYGRDFIAKLVEDLRNKGVTVYSGLAYGADAVAHKEAVNNNIPTVGVLAHGLDIIYPAKNKPLALEMLNSGGGLLSEYLPKTIPDKENFPTRNRIVAGLCDVVIVVESATSGGSLITADLANQYNREVMALPGYINAPYSKGCNWLIKNHKAAIIESIADLEKLMSWDIPQKKHIQSTLFVELNEIEQRVVDIVKQNADIHIDQLLAQVEIKSGELAMTLLDLEMKNCITALPGRRFRAIK